MTETAPEPDAVFTEAVDPDATQPLDPDPGVVADPGDNADEPTDGGENNDGDDTSGTPANPPA